MGQEMLVYTTFENVISQVDELQIAGNISVP